jgi:hypothetical protein
VLGEAVAALQQARAQRLEEEGQRLLGSHRARQAAERALQAELQP